MSERSDGDAAIDPLAAPEAQHALIQLADFDYELPPECIAQQPAARRDEARLLVMDRGSGADGSPGLLHHRVRQLADLLRPDDLLVMNATRVLSARLLGRKSTGGAVEALVLGETLADSGRFRALVRSTGRLRVGQKFSFSPSAADDDDDADRSTKIGIGASPQSGPTLEAELLELGEHGEVVLQFSPGVSPYSIGRAPLPPYIRRPGSATTDRERQRFDCERYQTVFARVPGAVAAPTAGLHFTPELLAQLNAAGIHTAEVVLHVGAGTFRPLRENNFRSGRLHPESYCLPKETARAISETRARGGRVVAVGTTTTRVLEACAVPSAGRAEVRAAKGETDLFLRPGSHFRVVDALLTNFHLPRSSLLLLVAAFSSREAILGAYREAIARGYRFYSYGDAMLIR